MTRIVLDTNVLVSAILSPGSKAAAILKEIVEGTLDLLICPQIIEEYAAVLNYPKIHRLLDKRGISSGEIERLLVQILRVAIATPGTLMVNAIPDDPSDNIFLACAIEGSADYIVSGDYHLIALQTFRGTSIVNSETFLKRRW
jgi:uncharacterized protein